MEGVEIFMKKKFWKRTTALLLAGVLTFGNAGAALAAEETRTENEAGEKTEEETKEQEREEVKETEEIQEEETVSKETLDSEESETEEKTKEEMLEKDREKVSVEEAVEKNQKEEIQKEIKENEDIEQCIQEKEENEKMKLEGEEIVKNSSDIFSVKRNGILADYITGNITAVNESGIWIDGVQYSITDFEDGFSLNEAARIWIEEKNKFVILEFYNKKLHALYSANEIAYPEVRVKTFPDKITYENGKFSINEFDMKTEVFYNVNSSYSFLPDDILQKVTMSIKQLKIKPNQTGLNFGKKGFWFFQNEQKELVHEWKQEISAGSSTVYEDKVYINEKYQPEQINSFLGITVETVLDSGEIISGVDNIEVGNLDLQRKQASKKKNEGTVGEKLSEAQKRLKECTAITLDANIKNYFTLAQEREIEEFLMMYIAETVVADKIEDSSVFTRVPDKLRKKARDKMLSKLGLSYSTFVFFNSTEAKIEISGETLSGKEEIFEFTISAASISTGDSSPFGSTGKIQYSIKDVNAVPSGASASGTGMFAYADMEEFANSMLDYLKEAYNQAWGKSANTIASMFVSKPIDDFLEGDYSGKLYKLMRKIGTSKTKKISVQCPVDVYVYDSSGNLCGTIINNKVDTKYQNIFLSADGDDKYIYIMEDDYKIELVGNADGSMSYIVEEYDGNKNVRTVEKTDIPLQKGKKYIGLVPNENFVEQDVYALCTEEGKMLEVDSDTYKFEETEKPIEETVYNGICGKNATWEYHYPDQTLIIKGVGEVDDYERDQWSGNPKKCPWSGFSIKYVRVEEGITNVGEGAFSGQGSLQIVELPNSVKKIGRYAFWKCRNLHSIAMGKNLSEIGDYALSYSSLHNIYVDQNNSYFKSVDNVLFSRDMKSIYKCSNGKKVYQIPNGITTIEKDAFGSNYTLNKIVIPDSVTRIKAYAFDDCKYLSAINFPNSVQVVEERVFSGCPKLLTAGGKGQNCNITIENEKEIPAYAFNNCDSLINVIIPDSVEKIGNNAFNSCENLSNINLPRSIKLVGNSIFYNCPKLVTAGLKNQNCNITIESRELPAGVFKNCMNLSKVELPMEIAGIGDQTFEGCVNLSDIKLPSGIKTIGNSAFDGCKKITSIKLPNNLTTIGNNAFNGCENLANINLPKNLLSGNAIFSNCPKLITVGGKGQNCNITVEIEGKLPEGLFQYSDIIKSVELPDSITEIGERAFYKCENLTNVKLPSNLNIIGQEAFVECKSLIKIKLPESLTIIGQSAFNNCENLSEINLPKNLKEGIMIFYGCKKLQTAGGKNQNCNVTIEIEGEIPSNLFSSCGSLTSVEIPDSVNGIGGGAFINCRNLKDIKFSKNVENIRIRAFNACESLEKIELPEELKSIGDYVFSNCKEAYLKGNAPETKDCPFNVDGLIIHVPKGSRGYDKYPWSNYKIVYDGTPIVVQGDLNGEGKVDIADVQMLFSAVSGRKKLTDTQKKVADVNNDGLIDISDVQRLFQYASKRISKL